MDEDYDAIIESFHRGTIQRKRENMLLQIFNRHRNLVLQHANQEIQNNFFEENQQKRKLDVEKLHEL